MPNRNDFQDSRYLRPIRQLDRVLINKIAAGEVIERPASVVKELVENSFDAGATLVDVVAGKAGTALISVTDNGCGIPAGQVKLAFSRHATSKIEKVDDLFAVRSFGFRGEALPSIASVSHLVLTTRHFGEAEGSRIVIEGGKQIEFRPVSAPIGTKVEVSHLFFNTPARRKFLKAETTEARQIIRVVERMALGKPSAAISLVLNERTAFRLTEGQPIAERMAALFSVDAGSIVEYDVELGGVSFLVYLAHPEQARNDRTRICLYINGRSVTSSAIIHAVTSGYGEFLPAGRFPLAVVFLTVEPERLDVNVHPTKAEVRLADEHAVHDNLYRIVQKALRDWRMVPARNGAAGPRVTTPETEQHTLPLSSRPFATHQRSPDLSTGLPPGRPGIDAMAAPYTFSDRTPAPVCDNSRPVETDQAGVPPAAVTIDPAELVYFGKVGPSYLLFSIRGELYIVDQHAAHERILYEAALLQAQQGSGVSQKLLFPETVELSAEEYLVYESSREVLSTLGFEIEPFGHNAVIVNGMPPIFRNAGPAGAVRALLDDIAQLDKAGGDLVKSVAQSLACRAAVMAGDQLSPEEVRHLVVSLFATNNPYCCPHGRPTFIKISREELDGRFGRT